MAIGTGAALLGGAAIAGVGSAISNRQQRRAQQAAQRAQQAGSQDALEFLRQQNAQAQAQLQPFQQFGLGNLQQLQALADPNSEQSEAQRADFQRRIAKTLAARGLTASGADIAATRDFELGLSGQRNQTLGNLANVGLGAANSLANLQNQLGTNQANIASGLGNANAQNAIALGQINARTTGAFANNINNTLSGLANLNDRRQQQALQAEQYQQLLGSL